MKTPTKKSKRIKRADVLIVVFLRREYSGAEYGMENYYLHFSLLDNLFFKTHYDISFIKGKKYAWENHNRDFKDPSEEYICQNHLGCFCFFGLGIFLAVVCYF